MAEKNLRSLKFPGSDDVYKIAQPDYAQTDSTQPDFIKNKIVGDVVEYGDTLTWDGNTEGLASFANYYKVSDTIVTIEDLQNGGSYSTNSYDSNTEMTNDFDSSFFTEITDGVCFAGGIFAVSENGVGVDIGGGAIFSEPGIYFQDAEGIYISALTISNYSGFATKTVKKLDKKYLPDGAGGVTYFGIDQDETTSTLYLCDYNSRERITHDKLIEAYNKGRCIVDIGDGTVVLKSDIVGITVVDGIGMAAAYIVDFGGFVELYTAEYTP